MRGRYVHCAGELGASAPACLPACSGSGLRNSCDDSLRGRFQDAQIIKLCLWPLYKSVWFRQLQSLGRDAVPAPAPGSPGWSENAGILHTETDGGKRGVVRCTSTSGNSGSVGSVVCEAMQREAIRCIPVDRSYTYRAGAIRVGPRFQAQAPNYSTLTLGATWMVTKPLAR